MFAILGLGLAEIIVIGIIGVIVFIVPIIVVMTVVVGSRRPESGGHTDELTELRAEVKRLRAEVERLRQEADAKHSSDGKAN